MALEQADLNQIQELIQSAIPFLSDQIMERVNAANSGMAASVSRQVKGLQAKVDAITTDSPSEPDPKPKEGDGEGRLTMKALQAQLQQLQEEVAAGQEAVAERDKRIAQGNKREALNSAIAAARMQNQNMVRTALWARHGEQIVEENGQYFVKDGESVLPISNFVQQFAQTEEGKHFLPPSGSVGTGAEETPAATSAHPTNPTEKGDAGAALANAFADMA